VGAGECYGVERWNGMWNVKRLSEAESKRPIVLLVAIADMPRPKREAYLARG